MKYEIKTVVLEDGKLMGECEFFQEEKPNMHNIAIEAFCEANQLITGDPKVISYGKDSHFTWNFIVSYKDVYSFMNEDTGETELIEVNIEQHVNVTLHERLILDEKNTNGDS